MTATPRTGHLFAISSITHFLLGVAALLLGSSPALAATFTVDSTADAVDAAPGDGTCATSGQTCTLRAAIQEANALVGADTIDIPAGTYALTLSGADEDAAATGDIDITDNVTISGAGATQTILDGNGVDRIFDVFNSVSEARISRLTIRNGNPGPAGYGGGLYNSGVLTLSELVVAGNTAGVNGGGIETDNDLTLIDCLVSGNAAAALGGGIDNALTAKLSNVTVSGNTADSAAGINNDFDLTLLNVTVSGNTATNSGGGIRNTVTASLTGVTIAGNGAQTGSGLNNTGNATFRLVLAANSPSGENCAGSGTLTSQGHNLDSGNSCGLAGAGDLVNTDPQLGPLEDNGGLTSTHALPAASPAVDAGGTDCPPPATDQRGLGRPADGDGDGVSACDIGAFELGATVPSTTTTLPCPAGPVFSSIDCRLDDLIRTVGTAVTPGPLRNKLTKIVTKAKAQVGSAEQAFTEGKKRREKSTLGRASRSLGKFKARLRSRKARQQISGDALTAMNGAVDQLRLDLTMLRSAI